MTDETFEQFIVEGIAALPPWVREELSNVAFLIADEPSEEQREAHNLQPHETIFGLYEGVPRSERGDDTPLMPDTITIFKRPILTRYTEDADIRTCVANTIWHEVAHYFGYDEEWVAVEEARRGKLL